MKALIDHREDSEDTLWQALQVVGYDKSKLPKGARTNMLSTIRYGSTSTQIWLAPDMSGILLDNKRVFVIVPSTKSFSLVDEGQRYKVQLLDGEIIYIDKEKEVGEEQSGTHTVTGDTRNKVDSELRLIS